MGRDSIYLSPDGDHHKGKIVLSKCAVAAWVVVTVLVIGKINELLRRNVTALVNDSTSGKFFSYSSRDTSFNNLTRFHFNKMTSIVSSKIIQL